MCNIDDYTGLKDMQILLANAKIMFEKSDVKPASVPTFQREANGLAMEMAALNVEELAEQLGCSRKLAVENWRRYQDFFCAESMPAIMAFNGQAYKHLKANNLSAEAVDFAQRHLWITCFLYGLLRPMDAVVPYRMEHTVKLPLAGAVYQFWRDKLTDVLIESVKNDDGVLVHLSTEEYEHLFDWQRVCREVTVVHPLFYVRDGKGKLKIQAVWAKSCRGAMVRYILENRISGIEGLHAFSYEGFEYRADLGEMFYPHFVRE